MIALIVVGLAGPLVAWAQSISAEPVGQAGVEPPQTVIPSVTVDPDQPGATPHWTITLGAPYCGGYRVGDGVYLSPRPPLALPTAFPDESVLFAGQPASVSPMDGALRVGPAPGSVQSMICMTGDQPLSVELLPTAGLMLPGTAGEYSLDVWTGASPAPINLSFAVPSPADGSTASGA